jgi:flagellar protein FliO/FliZ
MGSTMAMLARLVVSLGVVLALMAVAAAVLRRTGGGGFARRKNLPVEIVSRHAVGRRASLALVRTAGKGLVLGVTDHSITVLAETDPDELAPLQIEQPAGTLAAAASPWKAFLDNLRERSVRR